MMAMRRQVRQWQGVRLQPEVRLIGEGGQA
jgi:UDP-N-acetylenolpyruvoylglucosamine reductase